MPIATAATGLLSTPLQEARVILADCTEFRTWTGTANQTAALARIHLVGPDPPAGDEYTVAEQNALRPFAIVTGAPDEGWSFRHGGTGGGRRDYDRGGRLYIYLEQEVGSGLLNDPAELDRQFQNTMGEIIEHSTGNGLFDLSATGTYLGINDLTVSLTERASDYERVAAGDSISCVFDITWGNM